MISVRIALICRSVIAAAYENLAGTNQVHRAILQMLDPLSFEDFLKTMAGDVAQTLRVDCVRLVLESVQDADDPSLRKLGDVPKGVDVVFTTASHQCPTNATMPLDRRLALLEAAGREGFVIVEDDYEFEMSFLKPVSPALKSLDTEGPTTSTRRKSYSASSSPRTLASADCSAFSPPSCACRRTACFDGINFTVSLVNNVFQLC